MFRDQLTGLVLNHADRNPAPALLSLGELCSQVVIVQDSRGSGLDSGLLDSVPATCQVDVVNRGFDTYPHQRNAGLEKALGSWVLLVDSDEAVSAGLRQEIQGLDPDPQTDVFEMPKRETIRGRPLAVSSPNGRVNAHHRRLFRSGLRYAEEPVVHPRFEHEPDLQVSRLEGKIEHFPHETITQLWIKSFMKGRRYNIPAEGQQPDPKEVFKSLLTFLRHDKLRGAAVAGMVVSFALGTKMPKRPTASNSAGYPGRLGVAVRGKM